MVLPMEELMNRPPPEELIGQLPTVKFSIRGLIVVVIAELIAGYPSSAITDGITAFIGILMLGRGDHSFATYLPAFIVIANFNIIFQALTILQLILVMPGARYFFSSECVVPVVTIEHGKRVTSTDNMCSWDTVLGNVALCFSFTFHFLCIRFGWWALRIIQEASLAAEQQALPNVELMRLRAVLQSRPDWSGNDIDPHTPQNSMRGGTTVVPFSSTPYRLD